MVTCHLLLTSDLRHLTSVLPASLPKEFLLLTTYSLLPTPYSLLFIPPFHLNSFQLLALPAPLNLFFFLFNRGALIFQLSAFSFQLLLLSALSFSCFKLSAFSFQLSYLIYLSEVRGNFFRIFLGVVLWRDCSYPHAKAQRR